MSTRSMMLFSLGVLGCAAPATLTRARPSATREETAGAFVIVRVKAPWYATSGIIRGKFVEAVPQYEALEGLETKYFSLSEAHEFGGLYAWQSRAAADAHFDAAWHQRVRATRGVEADVEQFDLRLAVAGRATLVEPTIHGSRTVQAPMAARVERWRAGTLDEAVQSLAADAWSDERLIRAWVMTRNDELAVVTVWPNMDVAKAAPRRDTSQVSYFSTPVAIDARLR